MKRTRLIITNNLDRHGGFEEYFKIIDLIEEHENVNPDICIESCKALIEGISKTITINLDNTKTIASIDDDDLPKVFKNAIKALSEECEDIEGDFVARFSGIIQVLGEIRNKRGDISHGRMAPKFVYSSAKLASTVMSMTESMLEYILEHYFSIDLTSKEKLIYDSLETQPYNLHLDESIDFPIKKARYSKVLYENDYDEYELRYHDEYLKIKESETENFEEDIDVKEVELKLDDEIELKESIGYPEEVIVLDLTHTFNENNFWTEKRKNGLAAIALTNYFTVEGLGKLISDYLSDDRPPLRDDIRKIYRGKMNLREMRTALPELERKIVEWAQEIKAIEE